MSAVAELYDALHAYESRRGRSGAYPVHKRLHPERLGAADIYDWIVEHVRPPAAAAILDAGCGAGFGTLRLAEGSACRVTGITLSENELAAARRAAAASPAAKRVDLRLGSFDAPPGRYDLVVAVESLKHSADLGRSLGALVGALAPDGTLVIVEDLYTGADTAASAHRLARDWCLPRLYREADYVGVLGPGECRSVDLSAAVRRRPRAAILARLAALGLAGALLEPHARAAFRGGLHLEWLYATGRCEYKAIVFRRRAVPER